MKVVILSCVLAIALTQWVAPRIGGPVYEPIAQGPIMARAGVWPAP